MLLIVVYARKFARNLVSAEIGCMSWHAGWRYEPYSWVEVPYSSFFVKGTNYLEKTHVFQELGVRLCGYFDKITFIVSNGYIEMCSIKPAMQPAFVSKVIFLYKSCGLNS
jgi:hypothetical protein